MSNLEKIISSKKTCKSVWFMRQAGRYLPEFREIRSKNENFINLCLNSELSSEITLQPIKRYDLDSAIIFSDILMTPYALGQQVNFIKDQGPHLSKFNFEKFLDINEKEFSQILNPVYKAIEITRKKLNKNKSLISFIGAPWTLLVYMIDIKNNNNKLDLDKLNKLNLKIDKVLNKIVEFLCFHIQNQIESGANVVQIFDSWAGLIPEEYIKSYCYIPNLKIVEFCKRHKIPNICFPKGINEKYKDFNQFVKPDAINLDSEINPLWAKENLKNVVLQGGLNPNSLLKPETKMLDDAKTYIQTFKDIPYVFNLGHGLLPETDPDRVGKLIKFYRNFK